MDQEVEQLELTGEYEDFIGIYEHALDFNICDDIISTFDYYHDMGSVFTEDDQFPNSNAGRFDWAFDLSEMATGMSYPAPQKVNDLLTAALKDYTNVFGHMKDVPLYSVSQKVQKTPPGGGYHVWHDENSSYVHSSRTLVWMIYLNDNFEGGETEFLYYKKRIKPSRGTLLIWPAGMTHVHRGGLVLDGMKYVVTGWFYVAH
tara:strand:- start:631 stop:1236 length:606 start_codon:yes stop_codon:yes gene_type:complete